MNRPPSELELRAMQEKLRDLDIQLQAIRTGKVQMPSDDHWTLLRERQAIKTTLEAYGGAG